MGRHCIEIAVYRVRNPQTAEAKRRAMRHHVEAFPGFLGWHAITSAGDPALFADIVTWKSLEEARAASARAMADASCKPFIAEIGEVCSIGHYL